MVIAHRQATEVERERRMTFRAIRTPNFAHHSVAWSPFHTELLATASGSNFGLSGPGKLHVLVDLGSGLQLSRDFEAADSVYDLAWSESNSDQIAAVSGDGSVSLYDLSGPKGAPVAQWREHGREVFGIDWNNLFKQTFLTSSWDGSIKIWDCTQPQSLLTITVPGKGHTPAEKPCVYSAHFSPKSPDLLVAASSTGQAHVYDLRVHPTSGSIQSIHAHVPECLDVDWNKYDGHIIATGGVDGAVRVWDNRQLVASVHTAGASGDAASCLREIPGHRFAVKRVRWSPHHRHLLASTSYDRTCRILSTAAPTSEQFIHAKHTGFVHGCAWSLFQAGTIATASWDKEIHVLAVP